ncbi:MAG: type II secretion system protein, partial [Microthrixaceae bacterium]
MGSAAGLRRTAEQRGVTLIEAMIVIAITGLIMGPLAAAMISGLTSSSDSHERLIDNGAAQKIEEAWTKDVQSVDPQGVDEGSVAACVDPASVSPTAPPELARVSFNWDLNAGPDELPKTATWVLVQDGDSTTLERRVCEDGFRFTKKLAKGLGPLSSATVRGPDVGSPDQFCPPDQYGVGRTCTLVIPELNVDLTVTRRVPNYDGNTLPTGTPPPPAIFAHDARYQYVNVRFRPSTPQPVTRYELSLRKGAPDAPVVMTKTVNVSGPVPPYYQVTFGPPAGDAPLDVRPIGGPPVNYYVTAVAVNDMGPGPQSDAYGPMNPEPTGPDKPSTPVATRLTNGCIRVTWSPNPQDGGSPRTNLRVWAYEAPSGNDPYQPGVTTL